MLKTSIKKNELTELRSDGVMTKHWEVIFSIVTKRRTSYYVTGILLPVFLLSYLNTLVFVLPVESGEKVPGLPYTYTVYYIFSPRQTLFVFLFINLKYRIRKKFRESKIWRSILKIVFQILVRCNLSDFS